MAMSKTQKVLRDWFRRHGWHTCNTPTGYGFYLSSPVENQAGLLHQETDPVTGQPRYYCEERMMDIELDRFGCRYLTIRLFKRKHWWKRDTSVPANTSGFYPIIPTDDFESWPRHPEAACNIPAKDILKLAELIRAAQEEAGTRSSKPDPSVRWINVNSSYDEIKEKFSNERLKKAAEKEEKEK